MERLYWGVMYLLMPLMVLALPGTPVSLVCAVWGLISKSRKWLVTGACFSIPLFLYFLAGEAPWRAVGPIIVAMYFGAAYVVPRNQALATALLAPYFIFIALLAKALWFPRLR